MEKKYMNRYLDNLQKNQLNFAIRNHKRHFLITICALLILASFILGILIVKPSTAHYCLDLLYGTNIVIRPLLIILIVFLTAIIIFISKKLQLIITATEFQNMLFSNSTKKLCNFFLICNAQGEIFYKDERAKSILIGAEESEEKTLAIFGEKYKKQILKNLETDYQFNFNEYIISVTKMARPEGYFLISAHNDKKLVLYNELLQEAGICTYIIDNNTLVEANAHYKKHFGTQFQSNISSNNYQRQNEICAKFAVNGYYYFFSHYCLIKNNIKYGLLVPKVPQLNELLHKLPLPIAIFNKSLRLLDFNEKFKTISGISENNNNINNINNNNNNNNIITNSNSTSNNNINKVLKNKFALGEDQEIAIVELPFTNGNNTKAYITKFEELFIGIFTDFNAVHELQTKLEHSQKVSSIGELTGGIAHDFNNILTAILGFCEILLDDIDEKNQHYFDIYQIKNSAEKGSQLVKKLLAFARKQILTTEIININELIEGLHPILQRLINEDIQLEYYLARNLKSVKIDKGQFEQILINLVLNARDSIKNGGKLIIETSNIIIDTKIVVLNNTTLQETILKGEYIHLSVKDNGSGIGEDTLPKIFDPFFSTKGASGTGFGLSTAYGIIKQFKGYIDVKSSIKTTIQGEHKNFINQVHQLNANASNNSSAKDSKDFKYSTEFSIFIPTCYEQKEEDKAEAEALSSSLNLKPKRKAPELLISKEANEEKSPNIPTIMLVEDEQMIKDFLTKMLNKQGFQVITCKNSQEALKIFECNSVDIIITDVIMPGLSGPELIEEIQKLPLKNDNIKKELKVIFISGYTREKLQTNNLDKNYFFLEKPFTSSSLLKLIKEALEPDKRG